MQQRVTSAERYSGVGSAVCSAQPESLCQCQLRRLSCAAAVGVNRLSAAARLSDSRCLTRLARPLANCATPPFSHCLRRRSCPAVALPAALRLAPRRSTTVSLGCRSSLTRRRGEILAQAHCSSTCVAAHGPTQQHWHRQARCVSRSSATDVARALKLGRHRRRRWRASLASRTQRRTDSRLARFLCAVTLARPSQQAHRSRLYFRSDQHDCRTLA